MTSSTDDASRYEWEADATRRRLSDNLEELTERLTPGQMLDEVMTYTRLSGSSFFQALTNASRENPIPALLIGAGCMMFLSDKSGLSRGLARLAEGFGAGSTGGARVTSTSSNMLGPNGAEPSGPGVISRAAGAVRDTASNVADRVTGGAAAVGNSIADASQQVGATVTDLGNRASSTVADLTARAGSTVSDLTARASSTVGDLGTRATEGLQSVAGTIQETAGATRDTALHTAAQVKDMAAQTAGQVKDKATQFFAEEPLIVGAIALAVGAAIAAALPTTETENQMMGETSDALKSGLGEAASQQFETVKTAAGKVVEEAKLAADREGLNAGAAASAARDIGDKVKRVITEAAGAATPAASGTEPPSQGF